MTKLPSLAPNANHDAPKKPRLSSPRGVCEKFGLKPGELRKLDGETQRSEAVFQAREAIRQHHPRKFPDDGSVVIFMSSARPGDRIVREYRGYLQQFGWVKPEL